jgi:exosome complex component RRP4
MTLHIEDKELVIPGQVLATGLDYLPTEGTLRDKDDIISEKLGLASIKGRVLKVIPLVGKYIPKEKDLVIGKVKEILFSGWLVNITGPYLAQLPIRETQEYIDKGDDLSKYYNINDIIFAEVSKITRLRHIDLSLKQRGLGKLKDGRLINITPSKVPRVIGKLGSMINLIKDKTGCKIIVGQNGKIWIKGNSHEKELLAVKAINLVNSESHLVGLTDKVTEILK